MPQPPSSYVTVLAVAHPPGRRDDINGEGLSIEDIKRITQSKESHDYPIFMEHYRELGPIGKVIRTHLGPGDTLGIVATLDVNSISGAMVFRMLKRGEFVGLSVQIEPYSTTPSGVLQKRMLEVSFTKYPKLSQTGVLFVSEMLPNERDSPLQKEYDQLFKNYKGWFIFVLHFFSVGLCLIIFFSF